MNEDMKLMALRASRLAADLDENECLVLSRLVEARELADGEVLVPEGAAENRLHIIASGNLGIVKNAATDDRVMIAMLGAGELAGELGFIDGSPRQSALIGKGGASVVSLEREKFESLLNTHPVIVYHVLRGIIRTVHATQRNLALQSIELANYVYKQHGRY